MDWVNTLKRLGLLSIVSTLGMKTGIARRFVAGESMEEALQEVEELNRKGILVTLDILGENVMGKKDTGEVSREYCKLLNEIQKRKLQANISVKLTHLGLDYDRTVCIVNMEKILKKAEEGHNFVRIDMEGSRYTQSTLEVFSELWKKHKNLGVVIQSMLRRSCEDIQKLTEAKARIRLVKGAYQEPASIAYQEMGEIRKNFIRLMEKLVSEGNYPAIATHDDILIQRTQKFAHERGFPKDRFEFQMLYGLRTRFQEELARQGYKIRAYVPYGPHWLPYFIRRLQERRENVTFILKNLFKR